MLKNLYNKYFSSEFFRNVFTLSSGSVLAQAIPILLTPVLTRLFASDVFGMFFIYSSIFGVLTIISTLRLEMAILLPDNEKDATNLLAVSILAAFLTSVLFLVLIHLFKDSIVSFLDNPKIGSWLYFIPFF